MENINKPTGKSNRKEMLQYAKQEGWKGYSKMTKTELANLLDIKGTVKGARKGKKEKDANKPKRAKTAYIFFCQDKRKKVKEENRDATFGQIGAELGKMWRELGDKERAKYLKKNEQDKKRYEQEMAEYAPPAKEDKKPKKPSPKKNEQDKKPKKNEQDKKPKKNEQDKKVEFEEEVDEYTSEGENEPSPSPEVVVKKRGGGRKKKN